MHASSSSTALVMLDTRPLAFEQAARASVSLKVVSPSTLAAFCNMRWACLHGYDFFFFRLAGGGCTHPTWGRRHPSYCKLSAVSHVLALSKYDWVVFFDSDAFVRNSLVDLPQLLTQYGAVPRSLSAQPSTSAASVVAAAICPSSAPLATSARSGGSALPRTSISAAESALSLLLDAPPVLLAPGAAGGGSRAAIAPSMRAAEALAFCVPFLSSATSSFTSAGPALLAACLRGAITAFGSVCEAPKGARGTVASARPRRPCARGCSCERTKSPAAHPACRCPGRCGFAQWAGRPMFGGRRGRYVPRLVRCRSFFARYM